MTGQDAVNVAETFHERVAFDGIVMTKLDGDARGGAALSVAPSPACRSSSSAVGEKLDQLEEFHPDRMASRILGMGDVLSPDRAGRGDDRREEGRASSRRSCARRSSRWTTCSTSSSRSGRWDRWAGSMKMIPGVGKQLRDVNVDDRQLDRVEAIILLHDAGGAPPAGADQRLAPGPHRARAPARAVQQINAAAAAAPADEEDDEADGGRQDAPGSDPGIPAQRRREKGRSR